MSAFDASRWAEALAAASDASAAEGADDALEALEEIAEGVKASGLSNGAFSGESAASRLKKATASIVGGLSPGAERARRLTILLARSGRLSRVGEVAKSMRALLNERAGIVGVRVESAFALDEETRASLRSMLLKRTGAAEIVLLEKVDPELLGGVRIGIGWERIDGSLRGRLEALASATGAAKRGGWSW